MKTFDKKDVFTLVTAEEAIAYIGKRGYFGDSIEELESNINKGCGDNLGEVFPDRYTSIVFRPYACETSYGLFIPTDKVKEVEEPKKWRAFIFEEFTKIYSMNKPLKIFIYREKGTNITFFALYNGYVKGGEISSINLGGQFYTLQTLFDKYELFNDDLGKWQPFGVEE